MAYLWILICITVPYSSETFEINDTLCVENGTSVVLQCRDNDLKSKFLWQRLRGTNDDLLYYNSSGINSNLDSFTASRLELRRNLDMEIKMFSEKDIGIYRCITTKRKKYSIYTVSVDIFRQSVSPNIMSVGECYLAATMETTWKSSDDLTSNIFFKVVGIVCAVAVTVCVMTKICCDLIKANKRNKNQRIEIQQIPEGSTIENEIFMAGNEISGPSVLRIPVGHTGAAFSNGSNDRSFNEIADELNYIEVDVSQASENQIRIRGFDDRTNYAEINFNAANPSISTICLECSIM